MLLAYNLTSDPELTDGIVVRIYNDHPDDKRFSRTNEFLAMQVSKLNMYVCMNVQTVSNDPLKTYNALLITNIFVTLIEAIALYSPS